MSGFEVLADVAQANSRSMSDEMFATNTKRERLPIELWRNIPDTDERHYGPDPVASAQALESFTFNGVEVPKGAFAERTSQLYLNNVDKFD